MPSLEEVELLRRQLAKSATVGVAAEATLAWYDKLAAASGMAETPAAGAGAEKPAGGAADASSSPPAAPLPESSGDGSKGAEETTSTRAICFRVLHPEGKLEALHVLGGGHADGPRITVGRVPLRNASNDAGALRVFRDTTDELVSAFVLAYGEPSAVAVVPITGRVEPWGALVVACPPDEAGAAALGPLLRVAAQSLSDRIRRIEDGAPKTVLQDRPRTPLALSRFIERTDAQLACEGPEGAGITLVALAVPSRIGRVGRRKTAVALARHALASTRPSDTVAVYSEDAIVVALPGAPEEIAARIADRVIALLRASGDALAGRAGFATGRVDGSIGSVRETVDSLVTRSRSQANSR